MKGTVRWFNNGNGYGRIVGDKGKDYHAHFSQIATDGCGFRSLDPGEEVEFTPAPPSFRNKIPEAKRVKRSTERPALAGAPTFEKIMPKSLKLSVNRFGEITFDSVSDKHPRDYESGAGKETVRAYYLGHPGTAPSWLMFEVTLHEKVVNGNTGILATDRNGGLKFQRFVYDFVPGHFVLSATLDRDGKKICARAQKISLRVQDSVSVADPDDKGVWLVIETPFHQDLDLPEYADERELTAKIQAQIPEEFPGHPTANFTKFAKGIAKLVVAIETA